MPSTAYRTFTHNLVDVERLSDTYDELNPPGQGKRAFGHLTRSAIVTLCACWEQYVEDITIEGVELIRSAATSHIDLPEQVKRVLSNKVRNAKHEFEPFTLAGEGWRDVYMASAKGETANLHSPKTGNIQNLMEKYLGVTDPVHVAWKGGQDAVDTFVELRNSIAHKGRREKAYTTFAEVNRSVDLIHKTVVDTDNFLQVYFTGLLRQRPWNQKSL